MLRLRHDFMKSSMIMTVAAMLFVAVFAGIVIADDADAATATTVQFKDGTGNVHVGEVSEDGFILIPTPADVDFATERFEYWYIDNSGSEIVYKPGQSIKLSSLNDYADKNEIVVFNAKYTKPTSIDFIVDDKSTPVTPSGEPGSEIIDLSGIKEPSKDGFNFIGWKYNNTDSIYQIDDIITNLNTEPVEGKVVPKVGDTFTAEFQPVITVSWQYDDGRSIAIGDNDDTTTDVGAIAMPADPYNPNHTFVGWKVLNGDGTIVIKADADESTVEKYLESLTESMTFVAYFEPNTLTLPLVVDGEAYGTAKVAYGDILIEPTLPAGYGAWGVETTAEDGTVTVKEFDFSKPVTEVVTLVAIPVEDVPDESIYATFNIEGTIYGPYKVSDRFSIPQTDREGYNFLGWTVQGGDGTLLTSAQVQNYQYTEDVTFIANYVAVEPPAPEEPAFYETTTGQAAIVLVVFVIVLFVAAVYMNIGGLREKLFGWKITRKD